MTTPGGIHESFSDSAQVDLLCDRFEAAWKAGLSPDLAVYVLEIGEASRVSALRELLIVELEMRRVRGESPAIDEYRRRFPEHAVLVAEVFQSADRRQWETFASPPRHFGQGLHVRCPHCQNPIELVSEAELIEINCPSCGESFSFTGLDTARGAIGAPEQFGHYKLVEQLGIGAFGVVWKARDTQLDRLVAIKIPRKGQLNDEEVEKFLREARTVAQLRHPNIVSVHEVGREGDTVYLVSDLIQGMTLDQWIEEQKLTAREAAELCVKIAGALQHAHDQRIIHRDLKPQNILIDQRGEPHLTDFGLAKRAAGEITMTLDGQLIGTPAYMSPEQARGESHDADERSDVYSMGVILFRLLTGDMPFRGNLRMLLKQIVEDEPPTPRQLDNRIPRDLDTICQKCLAKEPSRRYPSAQALVDDLQRFLRGEVIQARPVGRMERSWRWCKRNPVVASLMAACVLILVSGSSVSTYYGFRSSREAKRADLEALQLIEANGRLSSRSQELKNANDSLLNKTNEIREQLAHNYYFQALARSSASDLSLGFADLAKAYRTTNDPFLKTSVLSVLAQWSETAPIQITLEREKKDFLLTPDGSRLITMCRLVNEGIQIWDCQTGAPIGGPKRHIKERLLPLSPDGALLATIMPDHTLSMWSTVTGDAVGKQISKRDEGSLQTVQFSPTSKTLVTGYARNVYIWDIASGELIGKPIAADTYAGPARDAVATYDLSGNVIGVIGDKRVSCWSAVTGEEISSMLQPELVWQVVFSPDSKHLATRSRIPEQETQMIRMWEVSTGRQLAETESPPGNIVFNPDGTTFAVGNTLFDSTDCSLKNLAKFQEAAARAIFNRTGSRLVQLSGSGGKWLCDGRTGDSIGEPFAAETKLLFSPDGQHLVTTGTDSSIRVLDAQSGKVVNSIALDSSASAIAFSDNGTTLATGTVKGTLQKWNVLNGAPVDYPLYFETPIGVETGQKYTVVTPAARNILYVVKPIKRTEFTPPPSREPNLVSKIGQSLGFAKAASTSESSQPIEVSDSVNSRVVRFGGDSFARIFPKRDRDSDGLPMKHDYHVSTAAFSSDGSVLVTGSHGGEVRLWHSATAKPIAAFKIGDQETLETGPGAEDYEFGAGSNAIRSIAFSAHGDKFVAVAKGNDSPILIQVFAMSLKKPVGRPIPSQILREGTRTDFFLTFESEPFYLSPDGKWILTRIDDQTAQLWDGESARPVGQPLNHLAAWTNASFNPGGSRVATASADSYARIWDVPTGSLIGRPMKHGSFVVSSIDFHPSGASVATATGSSYGFVQRWDATTGIQLGPNIGLLREILSLKHSPDGSSIVSRVAASEGTGEVTIPIPRLRDDMIGNPVWERLLMLWIECRSGASTDTGRALDASQINARWHEITTRGGIGALTKVDK